MVLSTKWVYNWRDSRIPLFTFSALPRIPNFNVTFLLYIHVFNPDAASANEISPTRSLSLSLSQLSCFYLLCLQTLSMHLLLPPKQAKATSLPFCFPLVRSLARSLSSTYPQFPTMSLLPYIFGQPLDQKSTRLHRPTTIVWHQPHK